MPQDEPPMISEHDRALLEMFDRYRDYVKHQYDLIQHRTTWFIVIQSFLFAAYGFTIQKVLEVVARDLGDKPCSANVRVCATLVAAEIFLKTIAAVGLATGIATAAGIIAGRSPLAAIYERSESLRAALKNKRLWYYLPYSSGGFKSWPSQLGPYIAVGVAVVLCVAWVALFFLNHYPSFIHVRAAAAVTIGAQGGASMSHARRSRHKVLQFALRGAGSRAFSRARKAML